MANQPNTIFKSLEWEDNDLWRVDIYTSNNLFFYCSVARKYNQYHEWKPGLWNSDQRHFAYFWKS